MDFDIARHNMIEQQIRTWEVFDQKVLDIMEGLHREDFMPAEYREVALADTPIPLAHNQVTMTPKEEARLLQALELSPGDRVLEIGTGSAWVSALLGRLCQSVISLDLFQDFIDDAKPKVRKAGIDNIEFICADGLSGFAEGGPYDAIVITGSMPRLQPEFIAQLNDGGRLFVTVGQSPVMEATLLTRQAADVVSSTVLYETDLPPLIGVDSTAEFVI